MFYGQVLSRHLWRRHSVCAGELDYQI